MSTTRQAPASEIGGAGNDGVSYIRAVSRFAPMNWLCARYIGAYVKRELCIGRADIRLAQVRFQAYDRLRKRTGRTYNR